MQLFSTKKRVAIGAGIAVLSLGIGTAAYAYFTTSGAGTGTATVGTAGTLTITQDAFGGGGNAAVNLTPGGAAQHIDFLVANNNAAGSGHLWVHNVTVAIPSDGSGNVLADPADTGSGVSGCSASWFSLSGGTGSGGSTVITVDQDLAPSASAHMQYGTSGLQLVLTNSTTTDQSACKGATVGLTYTSN